MLCFLEAELSYKPGGFKNYCGGRADGKTDILPVNLALSTLVTP